MMSPLHRLQHRIAQSLWEADPGYLHLRQGGRTLLAAVVTLFICYWPDLYTRVLACFAAALVCQGINGSNIQSQKITFVIATVALLFYFSLISYVTPYPLAIALVIIGASFSVFAIRALGPRYAFFPLFTWIMGFMTSLMPTVSGTAFMLRLGCVALGCIISFLIYFYVLPPRPLSYFFENIRYFIILVHARSLSLEQQLHQPIPFAVKEKQASKLRRSLRKYYLHNQTILNSSEVSGFTQKKSFLSLLGTHYLAGKALLMLQDNLFALAHSVLIEDAEIKTALCQSLKELSAYTRNIQVDVSANKIVFIDKNKGNPESFLTLRNLMEKSVLPAEELVSLYQCINNLNELCDCLRAFTEGDKHVA